MRLSVAHQFLPKRTTVRAAQVMDHFGISLEQGQHVIAADLYLPIRDGNVVLFTGASGSGKSSLMCAVATQLQTGDLQTAVPQPDTGVGLVHLDSLELPDALLIDSLDLPAEAAMRLLSTCGLGEAHLMLRRPVELSDGQRYRFRLALALSQQPRWIVADEFTATLDRTLAKVIAYNIRRLADRTGCGFLLATTHCDVTADLAPDITVRCHLDGAIAVESSCSEIANSIHTAAPHSSAEASQSTSCGAPASGKKKDAPSPSPPTCGFPKRPAATGRTSLGGITAAITSASPAS
ncbi:MAG: ATP-binding cassette domain-containing protein [Planctomycetaceae bacterium]